MKKINLIICLSAIIISGILSGCVNPLGELEIKSFSADPEIIAPGDKTTLHWVVTGATSVSINNNIGNVSFIGSKLLILNKTTEFILTAKNDNETIIESLIIYVKNTTANNLIIIDNEAFTQAKRDPFDFKNVQIINDFLEIMVGYSGGCNLHAFTLISKEQFMESEPVQIEVVLSHNAHEDPCEAYITDVLTFDLSPLKEKWQQEYQQDSGRILLLLENYPETIEYQFGTEHLSFLNVTIQTNKIEYEKQELIELTLFLNNLKEKDVTIEFPDSQVADFTCLTTQGAQVYLWSQDKAFLEVITPITIPAETKIELFNMSWNQTTNSGKSLESGVYILQGWIPGFYYTDENIDYSNNPSPNIYSNKIQITIL